MKKGKTATKNRGVDVFSIDLGEPVSILDKAEIANLLACGGNEKYYEPPVKFNDISRLLLASSHHQSCLEVKKNILLSTLETTPALAFEDLEQFVQDFLIFGNGYLQLVRNKLNEPLQLKAVMAKFVRVGKKGEFYFTAENDRRLKDLFHWKSTDSNQNIYGIPPYLGAVQALLLNESATLFRRKYYVNGAHAGSILYFNDAGLSRDDVLAIQKELGKTKGKGNFKNLFLYAPNGRGDGLKILPLSDSIGKDEFLTIKNCSRDDVLSAHRVPPQLIGIIPTNASGFGDVEKAARVFFINEIKPLQRRLSAVNRWFGKDVLTFGEYELASKEEKGK